MAWEGVKGVWQVKGWGVGDEKRLSYSKLRSLNSDLCHYDCAAPLVTRGVKFLSCESIPRPPEQQSPAPQGTRPLLRGVVWARIVINPKQKNQKLQCVL